MGPPPFQGPINRATMNVITPDIIVTAMNRLRGIISNGYNHKWPGCHKFDKVRDFTITFSHKRYRTFIDVIGRFYVIRDVVLT